MDLFGGTLDVIAEEMTVSDDEGQVEDRSKAFMDMYSIENRTQMQGAEVQATQQVSTFQRFSVDTNESLHFEPYIPEEDESGHVLGDDDVFLTGNESAFDESKELMEGRTAQTESDTPDAYCTDCQTPTYAFKKLAGPHKSHRVILMKKAAQEIKNDINKTRNKLEEKITQMENFAGNLEEIFITVEENFGRQEQNLEQHYNEVLQTLAHRYDLRASALEDEKKMKLESLYNQLIDCGRTLDTNKEQIEEAQALYRDENKYLFLQTVKPIMKNIEKLAIEEPDLKIAASLEFDIPAADLSDVKQMMDSINAVPAPSAPVMNPQIPNSASCTSLRVCWSLFSDDTVEYYELYSRPIFEDITVESDLEEVKVKVKETHYTVADLLPNAQYEFWVTATNTTGISPASEKAVYMTVPSPPVIKPRECTSCPDAALVRWDSGNTNPVDSYTLELLEMGAESSKATVTESIVAIPTCESLIQLQPGKCYQIYVRAVNIGGPSEKSESFTVTTTGTFFHLLEDTAHPCLSVSEDGFTMFYTHDELPLSEMAFSDNTFARCVAVLGDLIPVRTKHYWEVEVDPHTEYRIGVAYEDTQRNAYLGGNNTSWCMRHVLTPSRHKYEFLHNGWTPDIRITSHPLRIGMALDYDQGKLSFFNADLAQHLYTFRCQFLHYVHPCFALDNPGALTLKNGTTPPNYISFV
ncbi:fibronectin type III and SPRY domain-containing protein 2 [Clupea harengus]|uniref:Fibronectin type III and SPRY domain-containing protein 2 n=1 Tax=Clupea harengus TaxID=7950 RepID=A0A6P8FPY6_CLUHA|nr:fibronectin type III and SPRY domain-containing protein 2 [Clupea harengus]